MNTQRVEGHTPTPWKLFSGGEGGHILSIYSKREDDVVHWTGFDNAVLSEKEKLLVTKANAAFIVHACNNIERLEKVNEALVRALSSMLDHVKDRTAKEGCVVCDEAHKALLLAKEPA